MKIDNLEKFFEDVYKTSHLREMTATSFLQLLDGCIRSSLNNRGIDGSKLKELLSTRNALFTKGVENSTDKSIKSPTKEFLSYKDENGNELSGFITDDKTRNIETLRNFVKSASHMVYNDAVDAGIATTSINGTIYKMGDADSDNNISAPSKTTNR